MPRAFFSMSMLDISYNLNSNTLPPVQQKKQVLIAVGGFTYGEGYCLATPSQTATTEIFLNNNWYLLQTPDLSYVSTIETRVFSTNIVHENKIYLFGGKSGGSYGFDGIGVENIEVLDLNGTMVFSMSSDYKGTTNKIITIQRNWKIVNQTSLFPKSLNTPWCGTSGWIGQNNTDNVYPLILGGFVGDGLDRRNSGIGCGAKTCNSELEDGSSGVFYEPIININNKTPINSVINNGEYCKAPSSYRPTGSPASSSCGTYWCKNDNDCCETYRCNMLSDLHGICVPQELTPSSSPPSPPPSPSQFRWEPIKPMFEKRHQVATTVADGNVYVLGGFADGGDHLATASYYTPHTNKWVKIAPMILKRVAPVAATLGGNVYVMGGGGASEGTPPLGSVEMYDSTINLWKVLGNNMTTKRSYAAAAVLDNLIYVAGGCTTGPNPGPNCDKYLASVEHFDGIAWNSWGSMKTARKQFALIALDKSKMLIAAGGWGTDGVLASVEASIAGGNGWVAVKDVGPLGTARRNCAGAALDGKAYVLGGQDTDGKCLDSVERYDPATKQWAAAPPMTTPRQGFGAALGIAGSPRIYIVGGYGEETDPIANFNSAEGFGIWHECNSSPSNPCTVCNMCCDAPASIPDGGACEVCVWSNCPPSSPPPQPAPTPSSAVFDCVCKDKNDQLCSELAAVDITEGCNNNDPPNCTWCNKSTTMHAGPGQSAKACEKCISDLVSEKRNACGECNCPGCSVCVKDASLAPSTPYSACPPPTPPPTPVPTPTLFHRK